MEIMTGDLPAIAGDRVNEPDDLAIHRGWLLSLAAAPPHGLWVDLGCGTGTDLLHVAARREKPGLRMLGIDSSRDAIDEAKRVSHGDPGLEFRQHSLAAALPLDDATVDVAYSHNLIECLPDVSLFVSELARILRPGGQLVMAHWDWDSQLFDGAEKRLTRRLIHAFCDWKQEWMSHADGWMGRRLWSAFNSSGFFEGAIHAHVLMNRTFSPGCFGYARAQDMKKLVDAGLASTEDVQAFLAEQTCLNAAARYFYSVTGFAYIGRPRTS